MNIDETQKEMNTIHETTTRCKKAISLLTFLLMLCLKSNAQFDPMFTQYMNNEMFINPAYTGTRDVLAATLLYRNQWAGLEGAPKTQTFCIHSPLGDYSGAGLSFMNENIGITNIIRANANYSYRIQTSDLSHLSFGIDGGIINYRQSMQDLILVNQNDHLFTPNQQNVFAPNAGFGLFFYKKNFYLGLSTPRMIKNSFRPNSSSKVQNSASPKDWHYYLTSSIIIDVSDDFKFKPSIMIKEVAGAPIQGEISLQGLVRDFWWFGTSYRSGDALSVILGMQMTPQLRLFYSYDYSFTPLQSYNAGTHEITIGYDFTFKKRRITSPRLF